MAAAGVEAVSTEAAAAIVNPRAAVECCEFPGAEGWMPGSAY
jgi:hypothetical protein